MSKTMKFTVRRALTRALRVAHRMGYRWARPKHLCPMMAILQWNDGAKVAEVGISVWLDGVGAVWVNRPDGDRPMWGKCKCASCKASADGAP